MKEIHNIVKNYINGSDEFLCKAVFDCMEEEYDASVIALWKYFLRRAIFIYEMDDTAEVLDGEERESFWHIALGIIWNRYFACVHYDVYGNPESDEVDDVDESMIYIFDDSWIAHFNPDRYMMYIYQMNRELIPYGYMMRRRPFNYKPESKSKSFEEILDSIEMVLEVKKIPISNDWNFFTLYEKVGFDHVTFYAKPDYIDAVRLHEAIENKTIDNKGKKKNGKIIVTPANKNGVVLLPWDEHEYSCILIELSDKVKFKFNKSTESYGATNRKQDIYQLDIFVQPEDENLFNLQNYGVDELKAVVEEALDELWEKCGVYIRYESIKFYKVELNVTLQQDASVPDTMWLLRWIKSFQTEELKKDTYSRTENKKSKFENGKLEYRVERDTSMYLESEREDIEISLYDKSLNITERAKKKAKKDGKTIEMKITDELLSLEFRLKEPATSDYFDSTYLCKVTDDSMKKAWMQLVSDYLDRAYQNFVDESERNIKKLVKSLKKDTFREQIRTCIMEQLLDGSTPYMIELDSIITEMKNNSTFGNANNRKYYYRELRKLFLEPDLKLVIEKYNYQTLAAFVQKIKLANEKLNEVEIGYLITEIVKKTKNKKC